MIASRAAGLCEPVSVFSDARVSVGCASLSSVVCRAGAAANRPCFCRSLFSVVSKVASVITRPCALSSSRTETRETPALKAASTSWKTSLSLAALERFLSSVAKARSRWPRSFFCIRLRRILKECPDNVPMVSSCQCFASAKCFVSVSTMSVTCTGIVFFQSWLCTTRA